MPAPSTARLLPRSRMQLNNIALSDRGPGADFKKLVLESVGDLSGFTVLHTDVLVATYVAPRKTAGGILLPDKSVEEDRWQGKVGLVLKMGEGAFRYTGAFTYEGSVPKVGDYVAFHTSDTREIGIRGTSCRTIDCSLIRMIIPDPSDIY